MSEEMIISEENARQIVDKAIDSGRKWGESTVTAKEDLRYAIESGAYQFIDGIDSVTDFTNYYKQETGVSGRWVRALTVDERTMEKEERNRQIVNLGETTEMTQRQIADEVGVPQQTISRILTQNGSSSVLGKENDTAPDGNGDAPEWIPADDDGPLSSYNTYDDEAWEAPDDDDRELQEAPPEKNNLPLTAANHAPSADPNYDGDEWYTPTEYIEAARRTLGGIDLDPASCDEAQAVVDAATYYTKEYDSLRDDAEWSGRVWMNPPYSAALIQPFIKRLISEYNSGNVESAIVITNNSSDTGWFHSLLSEFPACFTRGRAAFWRKDQESFAARQGQTIFYLGDDKDKFVREFSHIGIVVEGINTNGES